MSKMVHCSSCDCDVFFSNIGRHQKTKRHLAKLGSPAVESIPENEIHDTKPKSHQMKGPPSMEELMSGDGDDSDNESDDESAFSIHSEEFLKDMENDVFGVEEEKRQEEQPNIVKELKELRQKNAVAREEAKLKTFQEKQAKQLYQQGKTKETKKSADTASVDGDDTEILGKDRRILMAKICMYKDMFKVELKHTKFRIKKGATLQDLEGILDEMQTIVSINGMEAFTLDIILGSLKLVEGVSTMTQNFDISGLADALKENPEFCKLVKLLFIKYQSFAQTPPEYRLIFIVMVNAVICTRMNKSKKLKTNVVI